MVFHKSLSNSKSPQVSGTLLSIRAVFKNTVVWMVSTLTLTFKSSRPFNNPLVVVPKAPITSGIIVNFMFHSLFFFQFSIKVEVLILLFTFFQFYSVVSRFSRVDNFASYLFQVFHTSVTRFFLTGIWVRESIFKSTVLFSVFKPISIILSFGWSLLFLLFPSINPLVTVPKAPITIVITVISMFHWFFNYLERSSYISFLSLFILFYSVVSRDSKVHNSASQLFIYVLLILLLQLLLRNNNSFAFLQLIKSENKSVKTDIEWKKNYHAERKVIYFFFNNLTMVLFCFLIHLSFFFFFFFLLWRF